MSQMAKPQGMPNVKNCALIATAQQSIGQNSPLLMGKAGGRRAEKYLGLGVGDLREKFLALKGEPRRNLPQLRNDSAATRVKDERTKLLDGELVIDAILGGQILRKGLMGPA